MGRGSEWTFFPRRPANGQGTHEKMLNITSHQGNANQNHNEVSPYTCQNGLSSKRQQITSVGKDVPGWWECKLAQPPSTTAWSFLKKLPEENQKH